MKRISTTKLKKELSALHVRYADFCILEKIDMYKIEISIVYVSWIKDDIQTTIDYLKGHYKVEKRSNLYIISQI